MEAHLDVDDGGAADKDEREDLGAPNASSPSEVNRRLKRSLWPSRSLPEPLDEEEPEDEGDQSESSSSDMTKRR